MYESFYNLKAEPFRLSPDHRFCFSHKSYAKAKAYMQYAIHRAEGFVMVTGKPGTGKTTLVNDLVDGLSQSTIVVATIVSTQLEADDLLRLVACNFGLDIDAPNKAVVLQGLSVRLRRFHEEGTRALLIIDEAQDLSASALEELRLLTNLQLNNQPLLQIFLIGQENLRDLIQKPSMEQVHQRLVAACHLDSLSEPDTKAYIRHRLERVGWRDDPTIDEGVYPLVFQFSKGVPRRINLICSRFLLHGCVEEKHRIRAADVRTVVQELQLEQLAPAGFEAELPSLMDDEESDLQPGTDNNPPTAPLIERTEPDLAKTDRAARKTSVATTPLSRPQPRDDEIPHFCSLEEQTKREGSHSPDQTQSTEEDVIQENYFSLGDTLDLPSEPIPIRQPVESLVVEQGYGDRFAKAQREKMTADPRTHYYNEYQARAHPRGNAGRKRSLLGITLLFMFILVVASITLYVIRPPLFQDSIERLEQKIGDAISSRSEQAALTPDRKPANTNSNDNTAKYLEATGLVTQDEAAQPAERVRETAPRLSGDPPGNQIARDTPRNDRVIDEQKKTAPVVEQSAVSATPANSETAQHTDNSAPPNLHPMVDTPAPIIPVALAPEETGQAVPELPIPITQTTVRVVEEETEEPVMAATPTAGDPLPMDGASPAPADEPASPVTVDSIIDQAAINGRMSQETVSTSYPPPKRKDIPRTPTNDRILYHEQTRETAGLPAEQASGQRPERQVLFNSNSTAIGEEYVGQLSEVVEWLKRHTEDTARIIGYADNSGNRYYNLELSFKRADAVAAYLEKKNIAKSRLHVEGRGVYPVLRSRSDNRARARHMQRLVKIVIVPPVN
ncbi:AAA family ATPase [Sedimenticola hydrogenitrophicus]|uniref:AAA family ATPase n=1 Tax=Sedimenticola hydrogenitrophicus TaxID=2967975 RepID=UPI0023B1BAAB|nr:AAA family ATPase [Sedimenticola hydrogenitrophicus]